MLVYGAVWSGGEGGGGGGALQQLPSQNSSCYHGERIGLDMSLHFYEFHA